MPTKKDDAAVVDAVVGDHDRVVMASRKPDGSPDQTPEFEYIGDRETTMRATKEQLRQQAVSAVDVAERGFGTNLTPGPDETDDDGNALTGLSDPSIAALKEKHDAAASAAESAAEAEVDAHFTKDPDLKSSPKVVSGAVSDSGSVEPKG